MKYLMEKEMAFDPQSIGFPSIQGCLALVYQTGAGLYGFHVAGASGKDRWPTMANLFAGFVHSVAGGVSTDKASRLYGASFVGNNERGYAGGAPKQAWIAELVTFATALQYTGKISGYDLFKSFKDKSSAYVEYRVNGDKCDLYIRKWNRDVDKPPRGGNPDPVSHKVAIGTMDNPKLSGANPVLNVDRNGLMQVSKEQLR